VRTCNCTCELTVDDNADPIEPGGRLAYGLSFGNPTTTPAQETGLRLPLPPGVEFVAAGDGAMFDEVGRSVSWMLGTVSPGQSGRRDVVVVARDDLRDGDIIRAASLAGAEAPLTIRRRSPRESQTGGCSPSTHGRMTGRGSCRRRVPAYGWVCRTERDRAP
jgi:hypothetical protein